VKSYKSILQGCEAKETLALDFALNYDFTQDNMEDVNNKDHRYIETVQGIEIYYQYVADYYFFCPAIIEEV
jgi:hypothetical protein